MAAAREFINVNLQLSLVPRPLDVAHITHILTEMGETHRKNILRVISPTYIRDMISFPLENWLYTMWRN